MNAMVKETSTALAPIAPGALTVAERAVKVFDAVPNEESLQELAKSSASIITITNQAGYDQCHAARMVLKNTRLEIARTGEDGRDDAVKVSKAIITRQKALIAITQPEEERLATIQEAWDDRIKAEREAKIQAEIARVAEIQRRIDGIRGWPLNAANQPSMLVGQMLAQAQAYRIEPEVFAEHAETAAAVLAASTAALAGLLQERKNHEAAQEQLKRDQEELAKLRAAEADRQRIAAADLAKQEAEDKARRDAEAARQAEANRIERERIAKEEAEAKAIRDTEAERLRKERAENERIASERQADLDRQAEEQRIAIAAEEQRIADQRTALAIEQEALRKANEPKPTPIVKGRSTMAKTPDREQIIEVIAKHYDVHPHIARYWLSAIRWTETEVTA